MTEFQIVPPPADGLADAFRTAAGRRRRTAATAGSASLLSAALVFAALTGSTGQVLTQEPAPPAEAPSLLDLQPVTPDKPVVLDPPAADPQAPVFAARGPGRINQPGVTPTATPAAANAALGPRQLAPKPALRYRAAPMTRTSYDPQKGSLQLPNCSSIGGTELCSRVTASGSGETGKLIVNLCNQGVAPTRLDFGARDEVDIDVRLGTQVVWRWAVGRSHESDPHQVPLPVKSCLEWTTPWAFVDQTGAALGAGKTYEIVSRIDSPDAGDAAEATYSYQHNP